MPRITAIALALPFLVVLFTHHKCNAVESSETIFGDDQARHPVPRPRPRHSWKLRFRLANPTARSPLTTYQHYLIQTAFTPKADSPAVIRAVRVASVSTTAFPAEDKEQLQQLRQQMEELLLKDDVLKSELAVVAANQKLISEMISFAKTTGKADLGRGVLDAESLKSLTLFSIEQRKEIARQKLELETRLKQLKREIDQNNWQQQRISKTDGAAAYQAQIFVDVPEATAAVVRLCYRVHGCGWTPQYTVRGKSGESSIQLQYAAVVKQMTGEPWNDVRLQLSTATPMVDASRPVLTPLRIKSRPGQPLDPESYQESKSDPFGGGVSP